MTQLLYFTTTFSLVVKSSLSVGCQIVRSQSCCFQITILRIFSFPLKKSLGTQNLAADMVVIFVLDCHWCLHWCPCSSIFGCKFHLDFLPGFLFLSVRISFYRWRLIMDIMDNQMCHNLVVALKYAFFLFCFACFHSLGHSFPAFEPLGHHLWFMYCYSAMSPSGHNGFTSLVMSSQSQI